MFKTLLFFPLWSLTYLPSLLSDAEMASEIPGTIAHGTDQKNIYSNKKPQTPYLGKGLQNLI